MELLEFILFGVKWRGSELTCLIFSQRHLLFLQRWLQNFIIIKLWNLNGLLCNQKLGIFLSNFKFATTLWRERVSQFGILHHWSFRLVKVSIGSLMLNLWLGVTLLKGSFWTITLSNRWISIWACWNRRPHIRLSHWTSVFKDISFKSMFSFLKLNVIVYQHFEFIELFSVIIQNSNHVIEFLYLPLFSLMFI